MPVNCPQTEQYELHGQILLIAIATPCHTSLSLPNIANHFLAKFGNKPTPSDGLNHAADLEWKRSLFRPPQLRHSPYTEDKIYMGRVRSATAIVANIFSFYYIYITMHNYHIMNIT